MYTVVGLVQFPQNRGFVRYFINFSNGMVIDVPILLGLSCNPTRVFRGLLEARTIDSKYRVDYEL